MNTDLFMEDIRNFRIPPEDPESTHDYESREECTSRGMWAIVTQSFAKRLAKHIDGRSVLEIMAGYGWLAKALTDAGVSIIATDNASWSARHSEGKQLYPVISLEASEAIEEYEADILLVSWPPYDGQAVVRACELWGTKGPIIYIGEGPGGCNAPEEWWEHFVEDTSIDIPIAQWYGLHDRVYVGRWLR